jgi:hypothetical protein
LALIREFVPGLYATEFAALIPRGCPAHSWFTAVGRSIGRRAKSYKGPKAQKEEDSITSRASGLEGAICKINWCAGKPVGSGKLEFEKLGQGYNPGQVT